MMDDEILLDAPTIEFETETDYETERGKPMPNYAHGLIQGGIGHLLRMEYDSQFRFPSELSLATTPPTTPDICIYPKLGKIILRELEAKKTEMPLTTIEILSPSQTLEQLQDNAWDIYFPAGVGSAWIVVPELKAIQLLLPDGQTRLFYEENLVDPTTGIEIDVAKVFEDMV